MLLISPKGMEGSQVVYALSGNARSVHLPRLEQIIRALQQRGQRACFDMEGVHLLEAGVIRFFAEGPGRDTPLLCPPEPLRSLRPGANARSVP